MLLKYTLFVCFLSQYVHCHDLLKRSGKDGTSGVDIYNKGSFIGIKVNVGTPPQEVELLLDTGSSSSWVVSSDNPYCSDPIATGMLKDSDIFVDIGGKLQSKAPVKSNSQPCYKYGVFDKNLSSTYNESEDKFFVKYFDGTTVDGAWSSDSFSIGDEYNLTGFDFGIGSSSNSSVGLLGLGIPEFKVTEEGSIEYQRDNIVMKLFKDGYISRKLFSIWLNHKDTDGGKILFGAVDYAKLQPPLVTMKMVNTERIGAPVRRYELMLTDVSFQDGENSDEVSLFQESETYNDSYTGALVDSGSMFNYLPEELFNILIDQFSYLKIEANDQYLVECVDEKDDDDKKLSFKFSSTKFNVPFKNFLLPKPSSYNKYLSDSKLADGKEYCLLNILPQYSNYTIFGQSFIRSIYTVFDMDKMEISMAPVVYTDKSEIEMVTIENPFNSTKDGDVAEELKLDFYDPQTDFVEDISNGYYKKLNGAGESQYSSCCYIAKLITQLAVVLTILF